MTLPHHLVTVWNPSYAQDAMDGHLPEKQPDELDHMPAHYRDVVTDGQLWAQREAERRGEAERMARELRDNLLGPEVWGALEPATRRRKRERRCIKTSARSSRCRRIAPSPGRLHYGAQHRNQRVLLEADLHGLL
jgi:hypothetical protein